MGKNKRQKHHSHTPKKHKLNTLTRPSGITKPSQAKSQYLPTKTTPPSRKPQKQQQHLRPTIPFQPHEHILLVGEGDLSFARSLITHHKCTNLTATVYELSLEELSAKYPHVAENIAAIEAGGGRVRYGVDATKMRVWNRAGKEVSGKGIEGAGGVDRVVFNFPHVGGKSKDVNRQVRYNQELLVSFFKHAMPSLSTKAGSSIIVTLFEGEPYTLWNIRDLARHSGLEVLQSFQFQAGAYPGYKHARTLGVVKGKDGEVGGGWKGEERKARSFVFVRKGEGVKMGIGKKGQEESSDDDNDDNDIEDEDGDETDDNELESDLKNSDDQSEQIEDSTDENDSDESDEVD